ncbi:MAG: MFS transporter [Gammaproteobacteria bacterium]|nr:MFS transporter [Gammaproteobacteria bacterium]
MLHSQFGLLSRRRFFPLFLTQFLGAFNDNLFKNALVILITFDLAIRSGSDPGLLVTSAAGIFILPFFLFSATAGQLADRYDKAHVIRLVKLVEVFLMLGAALGFYLQSLGFLFFALFLMGAQSAFFGPLKYGILPDHLPSDELISGNALIQAATFLAILLGTLAGGLLIMATGGPEIISLALVLIALAGWLASRAIPATASAAPELRISLNFLAETWSIISYGAQHPEIFRPILAVSWFWLVGATFLAQLPTFGKVSLAGDEATVTLLLLVFSIGIGTGSLLCNRLLRGAIHLTYVPYGALGISLFALEIYFASSAYPVKPSDAHSGVFWFLSQGYGWRVLLDMFMIALSGGIYIVPLNALIQARSEEAHRARNIATVNILNALFMVVSAIVSALLLALGFSVPELFLTVAICNLGAIYFTAKIS